MSGAHYEVYAIRYARHERTARENFIGGDPHDGPMPMDYFVWLVRGAGREVVVDCGFNAATATRRGRRLLRSPAEGLKLLGCEASGVRDLVITHLHYDHVGNFDLFPAATFHLQDLEMQYATGRHMGHAPLRHAFEVEDVVGMVRNVYAGRVRFHAGDAALFPGVSLHLVGGHTLGLQVVRVATRRGWVVLASDASHYYANMDEGRPFPIVFNVGDMIQGWERVRALADSAGHVIPGHDPLVLERYPAPSPALAGIVARLD
jgi:glyoxylase-like metal-dependent hydrolase (beta-lactamase superfamily II)